MKILMGADPELFVKKNGVFQSAHGLVPGDKSHPHLVENGAVQVDGMALEFNINPAATEEEFIYNITSVMHTLSSMVPEYEVVATPTAEFTKDVMLAQPEVALELGCEPDFNAYNGCVNMKPDGAVDYRTAAGHIHIGWTEGADTEDPQHVKMCRDLTTALDITLGLPSLLLDTDKKRRLMYGQAGAFRPKPYGVEYRVLSNFWIKDERLMSWVYKTVLSTVDRLKAGERLRNTLAMRHINKGYTGAVANILHIYGLEMPDVR